MLNSILLECYRMVSLQLDPNSDSTRLFAGFHMWIELSFDTLQIVHLVCRDQEISFTPNIWPPWTNRSIFSPDSDVFHILTRPVFWSADATIWGICGFHCILEMESWFSLWRHDLTGSVKFLISHTFNWPWESPVTNSISFLGLNSMLLIPSRCEVRCITSFSFGDFLVSIIDIVFDSPQEARIEVWFTIHDTSLTPLESVMLCLVVFSILRVFLSNFLMSQTFTFPLVWQDAKIPTRLWFHASDTLSSWPCSLPLRHSISNFLPVGILLPCFVLSNTYTDPFDETVPIISGFWGMYLHRLQSPSGYVIRTSSCKFFSLTFSFTELSILNSISSISKLLIELHLIWFIVEIELM